MSRSGSKLKHSTLSKDNSSGSLNRRMNPVRCETPSKFLLSENFRRQEKRRVDIENYKLAQSLIHVRGFREHD